MKKFLQLPPRERRLVAQALLGIMAARAMLRVFPLTKVRRVLWRLLSVETVLKPELCCPADRVIWAVEAAGKRSPFGSTCLASALVGKALFARHGHDSRLRIGVRRNPDSPFAAHAWLERKGRIVIGGPAPFVEGYMPLPDMEHLIR